MKAFMGFLLAVNLAILIGAEMASSITKDAILIFMAFMAGGSAAGCLIAIVHD